MSEISKPAFAPRDHYTGYEMMLIVNFSTEAREKERNRCLSILKSIEPINPSEAHLIETIVRRIRGSE